VFGDLMIMTVSQPGMILEAWCTIYPSIAKRRSSFMEPGSQ